MVKDTEVNEHNGSFTDWRLTLWGECIDPSSQELLPMPKEDDDDDHDVVTASPSFVSVSPGATETDLPANPTDHQHRPINAKPTSPGPQTTTTSSPSPSVSASTPASATVPANTTATGLPSEPPEEDKESSHFLPHYFPTFGVSKRTQVWIYGAFAIIVLFCAGLGTYFLVQRRKRRRWDRDDYEFEMLDDEDTALNGGADGRKKGQRAGELYDAFAGESDEEALLSDEEYRDDGPEERAAEREKKSRGEK